SGPFKNGQLNLSGATNRADIIFAPAAATEFQSEPGLPSVGPWESVRDEFVNFTLSWVESIKFPVVRMAFGAVLLCRTPDRKASYLLLKDLVPSVSVDPEGMYELSFRVNWPTKSKVISDLSINRITNWSAIQFQTAGVMLAPSTAPPLLSEPLHAVRLEIDH